MPHCSNVIVRSGQTGGVEQELLWYLFLLLLCEWERERWRSLCLCFLSRSRSRSPSSRCRRERWEDELPPSLRSTQKEIILSQYILWLLTQMLFDRKLILTDIAQHFWIWTWEQKDKEKLHHDQTLGHFCVTTLVCFFVQQFVCQLLKKMFTGVSFVKL